MQKISKKARLILFPFCKIVEGKERSIICDFQKEKVKFVPNEMLLVINKLKTHSFHEAALYFKREASVFNSYIKFLLEEDFAFFTTSYKSFPEIKKEWKSPEIINNAIIEYDFKTFDLINILKQLDALFVKFIELRFITFKEQNFEELYNLVCFCQESLLRNIRLYIPYSIQLFIKKIKDLPKTFSIIDYIIFYNSNKIVKSNVDNKSILYTAKTLNEITHSNINRKCLINNIQYFYECQKYNPYYNKKVSIDRRGNIKNCIKNRAIFGNILYNELKKVIQSQAFREFWFVSHDRILEIKDSELRYNYIITNDLEKVSNQYYRLI